MISFDYKTFLAQVPNHPGIYQMLDIDNTVIYVGKARDLKKRLSSYFRSNQPDTKTKVLTTQLHRIEVILTHSENEALLLECNLIKKLRPQFNILLKDDKSYPYLFLSSHTDFPRLAVHRGPRQAKGHYFGPYPTGFSARQTLDMLQKLFKIRHCSDPFFKARTRPCLQYQIKRCTAPCVAFIDPINYQHHVKHAILFLQGKSHDILDDLAKKMEQASQNFDYEGAARYRDEIIHLRRLQENQAITVKEGDVDVIAILKHLGVIGIHLIFIRGGRMIGNKSYFPETKIEATEQEALTAFLPQYYLSPMRGESIPKRIIVDTKLDERNWIQAAITEQLQRKLVITDSIRGEQRRWIEMAKLNVQHALMNRIANKQHFYERLEAFQNALELPNLPQRFECFDISHTMGEATIASCVVFDIEGASKKDYRRFNITGITPGDDYSAMRQALTRHYKKAKETERILPDILIIDGGKGQLLQAENVFEDLQIDGVTILGIAKGPGRKPGLETIYLSGRKEAIPLAANSPALHLLQQIRDEAHRFAITGHRKKRAKSRQQSVLEEIPGIGAKRRRDLLKRFGGLQEIKRTSVDELTKVPGINEELAKRIFAALHSA